MSARRSFWTSNRTRRSPSVAEESGGGHRLRGELTGRGVTRPVVLDLESVDEVGGATRRSGADPHRPVRVRRDEKERG
jgi:hypothetical protein